MPVKRRNAKRRISTEQLFSTWGTVLTFGGDYFGDLKRGGFKVDNGGRPDREEAREMWRLLGGRVLAEHDPREKEPWGLTEFGDPTGGNHAD